MIFLHFKLSHFVSLIVSNLFFSNLFDIFSLANPSQNRISSAMFFRLSLLCISSVASLTKQHVVGTIPRSSKSELKSLQRIHVFAGDAAALDSSDRREKMFCGQLEIVFFSLVLFPVDGIAVMEVFA